MLLKASERAGGRALATHLLNAHDNDHVEIHELRGFCVGQFPQGVSRD